MEQSSIPHQAAAERAALRAKNWSLPTAEEAERLALATLRARPAPTEAKQVSG